MKTIGNLSGQIAGCGRGSERGAALVIALFLITTLTILGVLVLNTSIVEIKMANNQKISSQAFYAAEAGLERALAKVMRDYETDGGNWGNGFAGADTVNAPVRGGTGPAFALSTRTLDMWLNSPGVRAWSFTGTGGRGGTGVGRATYQVFSYTPNPTEIYFLSYATQPDAVAAVEYHMTNSDLSPYNNAVFSGAGITGHFTGSINLAGSIYSIGSMEATGNVTIANNYADANIKSELSSLIPAETTLNTKVSVRGGNLILDGNAKIGTTNAGGQTTGVYVDGTISNTSKIVTGEISKTVASIPFPSILDGLIGTYGADVTTGYGGTGKAQAMAIYKDLARGTGQFDQAGAHGNPSAKINSSGVYIPGGLQIQSSTANFSYSDSLGNGLFWNNATRTLTIIGVVYVETQIQFSTDVVYVAKGPFTSDAAGNKITPANQNTTGALLVVGNQIQVSKTSLKAKGGYLGGGDGSINSLGIVVGEQIQMETKPNQVVTGMFYCPGTFQYSGQGSFGGTIIGGGLNFEQVPDIYQVPDLKYYLPVAMPGATTVAGISAREWRRVY